MQRGGRTGGGEWARTGEDRWTLRGYVGQGVGQVTRQTLKVK